MLSQTQIDYLVRESSSDPENPQSILFNALVERGRDNQIRCVVCGATFHSGEQHAIECAHPKALGALWFLSEEQDLAGG